MVPWFQVERPPSVAARSPKDGDCAVTSGVDDAWSVQLMQMNPRLPPLLNNFDCFCLGCDGTITQPVAPDGRKRHRESLYPPFGVFTCGAIVASDTSPSEDMSPTLSLAPVDTKPSGTILGAPGTMRHPSVSSRNAVQT